MEENNLDNESLVCSCGELHKGHICWLSNMGLLQEVQHLSIDPNTRCRKCGAKVNRPHNVCFPEPLEKE